MGRDERERERGKKGRDGRKKGGVHRIAMDISVHFKVCHCSVISVSLPVVSLYHRFVAVLNFQTQEVLLDFLFLCV